MQTVINVVQPPTKKRKLNLNQSISQPVSIPKEQTSGSPDSPYLAEEPYDTQTVTDQYIQELRKSGVSIPTISKKKYKEMQDYYFEELHSIDD